MPKGDEMTYEYVDFETWCREISTKVALLEDKMNAVCAWLKIDMKVEETKIIVSTKVSENLEEVKK